MAKNDFFIGIYIIVLALFAIASDLNLELLVLWSIGNIVYFSWRESFRRR